MVVTIISGSPNLKIDAIQLPPSDITIGVDYGAYQLVKHGQKIDIAIGDFDSVSTHQFLEIVNHCPQVLKFERHKDETDTELAIKEAIRLEASHIYLYGVTGGRVDHFLSTIGQFKRLLKQGVKLTILDPNNRITMLEPGKTVIKKSEYKFISFFSYQEPVKKLTLKGFKFDLEDIKLNNENSLTMSNEIKGEEATVEFEKGLLLVVESRD